MNTTSSTPEQNTNSQDALLDLIGDALNLRFGFRMPQVGEDLTAISTALLNARQRLDSIDDIFVRVLRFRHAAKRQHAITKARMDDAWDDEIVRNLRAGARRGDEYLSAKERYALANLEVIDMRHTEREEAELLHRADEAVEVVRHLQRNLSDIRQELLTMLRTLQFETTLDR